LEAHPSHGELTVTDGGAQEQRARTTGQEKSKARWKRRITVVSGLIALLAAGLVLPPLVNISRYQRRVAALMAQSFGRPVHMSSVELRLLPLPGFVLHDLSVSEDPEFGVEPILSARTVVASVRLQSLWRGKLEVNRVSVDEASLNLVRTARGRWNLSSLMLSAQPALAGGGSASGPPGVQEPSVLGTSAHFPYLEATDSRVNLKNGVEKSPFSLVSADLSLWQDEPGKWRVRLRGQPVRTDMEMSLGDTGQVRVEASLQSAKQLHEMPLNLQMEWRDAQLGQLSRLLLGSDAGWRGDVTADIEVRGTPDSAQTKARLRATGVRREEFAPETPLDFDANCGFRYQHSQNALHELGCDTAIGSGRLHLKAELPGNAGQPEAMLDVQQVPLQAGLDVLRTIRSGFAPGISAQGTANGSLNYHEIAADLKGPENAPDRRKKKLSAAKRHSESAKGTEPVPTNLRGTITVEGGQLKGGQLKEPFALPRLTLTPALVPSFAPAAAKGALSTGLGAKFTIALGPGTAVPPSASKPGDSKAIDGSAPAQPQAITVRLAMGTGGFDAVVSGAVATARLRELAYAFGLPHLDAADSLEGGTADFDVTAAGPWISSGDTAHLPQNDANSQTASGPDAPSGATPVATHGRKSRLASATVITPAALPGQDSLSASVQLHHTSWKAAYLARPVEMALATATFSDSGIAFTSDFSYGNAKESGKGLIRGSAQVNASANCQTGVSGDCEPKVQLRFGALDAEAVQAALLGTPEEKSLFSPLIERMRSSDRPKWPDVTVNVQAESLTLGSVVFQKPLARLRLKDSDVVIEDWEADLLGGSAKGTGRFTWTAGKPVYAIDGNLTHLNAESLGALMESKWSGGPLSGRGSIQLSGLNANELTASAAGGLRFDWPDGEIPLAAKEAEKGVARDDAKDDAQDGKDERLEETRFDDWSGAVSVQGGKAQLGENTMRAGRRSLRIAGAAPLGGPVKLTIAPSELRSVARSGQTASLPAVK
jgi:AsmA-like protein